MDDAIAHLKMAIRLNPFPPYWYYKELGTCYILKGQYEDALAEYKKGLKISPDVNLFHLVNAAAYALLGREEEAKVSAAKYLESNPNFSVALFLKTSRFKNQAHTKIFADAFRKAGIPE